MKPKRLKILSYFLVLTLVITVGLSGSIVGCKKAEEAEPAEETAPAEEEVAEEAPAEEEVAEEAPAEEEVPELGTEGVTYWIDKAGITPSGEITIYSYKDEGVTEWKVAQKFMEIYPDVKVNWVTIPGADYATKIMMECETGTEGFDLMWCYAGWSSMFKDYLEDVTGRIPEELKNDIVPGIISSTGFGDKWFGIPLFLSTFGIVYNKDILQQAGYDAPPETWDEFIKCAEECTIDEDGDGIPEIHGYTGACGLFGYFAVFNMILKTVGGQFWNYDSDNPQPMFNNEYGVRALQIEKQLYMSDFSDPVMASGDEVATRRSVASGAAAMGLEGIGSVFSIVKSDFPENEGKLGWSIVPYDPGYESYGINGSMGFAIRKGGNVDTALAFDLFYASPEIQKFVTEDYGFATSRMALVNDEEYVEKFPYVPAAIEQGKRTERYVEQNVQEVTDGFKPIFDRYFNGEIDEETALSQMEEVFNTAWEE